MGRVRAKHRYLTGAAVCALLAVRSAFDTASFLGEFSDNQSSYPTIPLNALNSFDENNLESIDAPDAPDASANSSSSSSRNWDNGNEYIDFYASHDKNLTGWLYPRVVVLSASEFSSSLSSTIDTNAFSSVQDSFAQILYNKHQRKEPLGHIQLPDHGMDDSGVDLPESGQIAVGEKVYRDFEREWYEDCEPVSIPSKHNNQKGKNTSNVRSTCNVFHELNLVEAYGPSDVDSNESKSAYTIREHKTSIELLGEGSWRSVWKLITHYDGLSQPVLEKNVSQPNPEPDLVLKLLLPHHDYDENSFSIHQTDAFVMEALSASNYVVDSFGFCGQSVITEAAVSSGRSLIKTKTLSSVDRLRIARDLARGLADLHALSSHPWERHETHSDFPSVFAHHDVNPANLIGVRDGKIRWNDFNLGLFNRQYVPGKKREGNLTECPVPVRYEQLLWRSPEECQNHLGTLFLDAQATGRNTAAQAADVYSLGNILFYVLARHQPWSHLEDDQLGHNTTKLSTGTNSENKRESLLAIARAKIDGNLPNLPERYRKRPGAKLLFEAVKMCYTHDPRLRPTAFEIAEFLGDAHAKLLLVSKPKKEKKIKTSGAASDAKEKSAAK